MKSKKIIIAILTGLFIIVAFLFFNARLLGKRIEWNKISEDYDIIAGVAFDYYKEHINERNTHDGTIFLDISKDGKSLTQTVYSPNKEDTIYYINLDEKQKTALKNISTYYNGPQRQELIMINSAEYLEITDDDAVGVFAVIKSKEKPANQKNYKIYNLGNDWWQVESTAR